MSVGSRHRILGAHKMWCSGQKDVVPLLSHHLMPFRHHLRFLLLQLLLLAIIVSL